MVKLKQNKQNANDTKPTNSDCQKLHIYCGDKLKTRRVFYSLCSDLNSIFLT